ncbi:hypothetical protein FB451DRAFT_1194937 [Mycena latifolia]|nr:hypothetical protein FB451DRAFT_1194937 [Mycena latifolia]
MPVNSTSELRVSSRPPSRLVSLIRSNTNRITVDPEMRRGNRQPFGKRASHGSSSRKQLALGLASATVQASGSQEILSRISRLVRKTDLAYGVARKLVCGVQAGGAFGETSPQDEVVKPRAKDGMFNVVGDPRGRARDSGEQNKPPGLSVRFEGLTECFVRVDLICEKIESEGSGSEIEKEIAQDFTLVRALAFAQTPRVGQGSCGRARRVVSWGKWAVAYRPVVILTREEIAAEDQRCTKRS